MVPACRLTTRCSGRGRINCTARGRPVSCGRVQPLALLPVGEPPLNLDVRRLMSGAVLCPSCHSRTAFDVYRNLPGYKCSSCEGIWVTGTRLSELLLARPWELRLTELADLAARGAPSTRKLRCPSCRRPSFRTFQVAGIELDMCKGCAGLYIDRSEFRAFTRATRRPDRPFFTPDDIAREISELLSSRV